MKKNFLTYFILLSLVFVPLGVFAQSPFGQEPEDPGSATDPGTGTSPEAPTGAGGSSNDPNALGAGGTQVGVQGQGVQGNGLMPASQNAGAGLNAGTGLNAGNGQNASFWQYILSLIGAGELNGKNNQSSFKNQETKVDPLVFKEQWTAPTPIKNPSQNTTFSCKFNASKTSLGVFLSIATCFVFALIPIMIALLLLWFMFGSIKYINDSEHENRGQYKTFLVWGVIILFVALSFVGILRVMSKTLGI